MMLCLTCLFQLISYQIPTRCEMLMKLIASGMCEAVVKPLLWCAEHSNDDLNGTANDWHQALNMLKCVGQCHDPALDCTCIHLVH